MKKMQTLENTSSEDLFFLIVEILNEMEDAPLDKHYLVIDATNGVQKQIRVFWDGLKWNFSEYSEALFLFIDGKIIYHDYNPTPS